MNNGVSQDASSSWKKKLKDAVRKIKVVEDADTGERTKILCCGVCCDARRACIIIDCIYFSFVVFATIMQVNEWNPFELWSQQMGDDDYVEQGPQMFDASQTAAATALCTGPIVTRTEDLDQHQPYTW